MLTVTHGRKTTRRHVFAYTFPLAVLAIGLAFTSVGGPIYLTVAVILNALFVKGGWDILRRDEPTSEADGYKVEKRYFAFSLLYLFLHFGAILAEAALRPWGLGGW
jgi:protoheme IX farnesyltransferase